MKREPLMLKTLAPWLLGLVTVVILLLHLPTPIPDTNDMSDLMKVLAHAKVDYYCSSEGAQGVPAQGFGENLKDNYTREDAVRFVALVDLLLAMIGRAERFDASS